MKLVYRYIIKTISLSSLMVLFLLFSMQLIIWLLGEAEDLGVGDYHLKEALLVVLLQIPYQLCELFPFVCLLGSLLGLGQLASSNELIILRVSGISIKNLVVIVLFVALIFSFIVSAFQEFIAPYAVSTAHNQKTFYTSSGKAIRSSGSLWVKNEHDYIYVGKIEKNKLNSINRYEFDDQFQLAKASFAEVGVIKNGQWEMKNVYETSLTSKKVTSKKVSQSIWKIDLPEKLLTLAYVYPEELTIRKLHAHIKDQDRSQSNYDLLYWQRIFQPLNVIIMMLLAIPIIIGPLRGSTIGLRMLVGTIIGFAFYLLDHAIGAVGVVYQLPIWLVLLMPVALFFGMGMVLVKRYR